MSDVWTFSAYTALYDDAAKMLTQKCKKKQKTLVIMTIY